MCHARFTQRSQRGYLGLLPGVRRTGWDENEINQIWGDDMTSASYSVWYYNMASRKNDESRILKFSKVWKINDEEIIMGRKSLRQMS